ncbi:MAG: Dyp-type peroxidase [Myxococcales bacterium]|nr:Dyp-type peroxidase [Myxococcales bacterium]
MTDPDIDLPSETDFEDIQGIVYTGWTDHPYAGFVFATLGPDPAASRAWLDSLRHSVTPVAKRCRRPQGRMQVALSPSGLLALGVPHDVIAMMPVEATEGMATRQRALADTDPATWRLGGPGDPLDVLVMVYARTAADRDRHVERERDALEAAGARLHPSELSGPVVKHEHFGFADGVSRPFLAGRHASPRPGEDTVATGEILLGYRNAYGRLPTTPLWGDHDLGKNGTYLVFRKLQQNVAAFWGWVADQARRLAGDDPAAVAQLTEQLGAKVMGRWISGASLVLSPDRDDRKFATLDQVNAFNYLKRDPDGLRCPIASHARRANPRDARGGGEELSKTVVNRHRILRRGRSYGAQLPYQTAVTGQDDGVDRGLYFICLQSSIARGFEFIQQTWLANPGFLGLHREPDPLLGPGDGHITIPADPVRLRLANVPRVVTNQGGGYFFVPSLQALERIAIGP